jgi:hypothetical protein
MTEYAWPDEPYRTVRIGCTGRGTHDVEKFGTARVWPDGTIDLRLRPELDQTGGARTGQGVHEDLPRWPHTALHCPRCPRGLRFQPRTLQRVLVGLADRGAGRLDLSRLPF